MWLVVLGLITVALAGACMSLVVVLTRRSRDGETAAVDPSSDQSAASSRTWLDPLVAARADSPHSEAESLIHQARVTSGGSSGQPSVPELLDVADALPPPPADPPRPSAQPEVEVAAADAVQHALASLREREDEMRDLRKDLHDQHLDIERREQRLIQREERLDEATQQLDERASELAQHDDELAAERLALLDLAARAPQYPRATLRAQRG